MHFKILLNKEIKLELRSLETFWGILGLSILLAVVAALGVQSALVSMAVKEKLFAGTIWLISFCSASLFIPRSFEREWSLSGLSALLLRGVKAEEYFLAKAISLTLITWLAHILLCLILTILLNLNLDFQFLTFIGFSLPILGAFCLINALLAPLTYRTKLGSSLLSLVALPVLLPLFLCAMELTQVIFLEDQVSFFWASFLIFLLSLYLLLGSLLAKFTYTC